ncbi:hypothetical protein HH682_14565 [Rosenbergiella sp. S61]|uniref:Uncharacterized protein n=1 Tax=Rosenbergiella gaditana TaxID=2726987 RepID=A0ABS5T270_9GAMM|nr:hypothetical protein [Rosenbergiella gaditana]MBT0725610.1 hypothetical protein [Rosenbergiella gaditana]
MVDRDAPVVVLGVEKYDLHCAIYFYGGSGLGINFQHHTLAGMMAYQPIHSTPSAFGPDYTLFAALFFCAQLSLGGGVYLTFLFNDCGYSRAIGLDYEVWFLAVTKTVR